MKKQFKTSKRYVALGQVNVDQAYQRKLKKSRVEHISEHFDPDALGIIHVSERKDGSLWVVDGQHRVHGCRKFLGDGWEKQHVEALVYIDLTRDEEAWLFDHLNDVGVMRPFDRFRARLVHGEEVAVAVNGIASKAGFTIADGSGSLSCVGVMEQLYNGLRAQNAKDGPGNLALTLAIVNKSWGNKSPHPNGNIIHGLGMFLERYGGEIDTPRLVKKLAEYPGGFSGLLGKARALRDIEGGQVAHAVFELIRRDYNVGIRQNKLKALRAASDDDAESRS